MVERHIWCGWIKTLVLVEQGDGSVRVDYSKQLSDRLTASATRSQRFTTDLKAARARRSDSRHLHCHKGGVNNRARLSNEIQVGPERALSESS